MAYAAGRTDSWKRSRRAGSGAPRETDSATKRTPASHSSPKTRVSGTSVLNPTSGEESSRSPISPAGPSPSEIAKRCRASRPSPVSSSTHSTATRAAQPTSSRTSATARCRSGRRNPAATTRAPTRLTESGSTESPASVSAIIPASPESPTEPPTAITTTAATTLGNAPPGRSALPRPTGRARRRRPWPPRRRARPQGHGASHEGPVGPAPRVAPRPAAAVSARSRCHAKQSGTGPPFERAFRRALGRTFGRTFREGRPASACGPPDVGAHNRRVPG